jgi:CRISPR/Cas system-associated protein endoribonuclease Cas2
VPPIGKSTRFYNFSLRNDLKIGISNPFYPLLHLKIYTEICFAQSSADSLSGNWRQINPAATPCQAVAISNKKTSRVIGFDKKKGIFGE